jgi:hypothetical protein
MSLKKKQKKPRNLDQYKMNMKSNIILRAFFGVVNAKLRKPCNSKNKIWLKFVDRENNDSYICLKFLYQR